MPPKKNNDKIPVTAKKTEPKTQKTSLKKEKKPPLKTPSVIRTKLKIPGRNPPNGVNESARLNKNLSKLQLTQAKIDLANEVARFQLLKPKEEEEDVKEETLLKPVPKGKKRPAVAVKKNGVKDVVKKKKLVRKKNVEPVVNDASESTDDNTPLNKVLKLTDTQAEIDKENALAKLLLLKTKEEEPVHLSKPKLRGRNKSNLEVTKNEKEAVKKKLVRRKKNEDPVVNVPNTIFETPGVPMQAMSTRKRTYPTPAKKVIESNKEVETMDASSLVESSIKKELPVEDKNVEAPNILETAGVQAKSPRKRVHPTPVKKVTAEVAMPALIVAKKRGRHAPKKAEDVEQSVETIDTPIQTPTRNLRRPASANIIQATNKEKSSRKKRQPAKYQTQNEQVQSEGNTVASHLPSVKQTSEIISPPLEQSRCSSANSFSWTKDISSSSTTTCRTVSCNDFFCIDKKLPIIQLYNIDNKYDKVEAHKPIENNKGHTLSESEIETDRREESSSSSDSSSDISTSSSSSRSRNSVTDKRNTIEPDDNNITYALDKMTAKLNTLDLDIIEWIGHNSEEDNDIDVKKFQEKILNVFKHESEIMQCCNNLQRVLSDDIDRDLEMVMNKDYVDDNVFVKPISDISKYVSDKSEDGDIFTSRDSRNKSLVETYNGQGDSPNLKSILNTDSDNIACESRRMSLDQNYNDDDDTLSLFADESFTMETSRISTETSASYLDKDLNSNLNSKFEEYVPEPVNKYVPTNSYNPTKIQESITPKPVEGHKTKIVCEKQNADSTSIYRETDPYKVTFDYPTTSNFDTNIVPTEAITPKVAHPTGKTSANLLASGYASIPLVRSNLFKGVCFFNLINSCKKKRCNYPHVQIELVVVKDRLQRLSETQFIQEYMLMRIWPCLRRRYAILFLEECVHRELTRVLVEMALDFVMKAKMNNHEDTNLKVQVVEQTLINLNQRDLSAYHDLLNYNLDEDVRLCDVLMKSIAETQNFSRFKLVFTNLTDFMVKNRRTFSLDVASHILERVCILPCEEPLYRTLLKILNNTDSAIFGDPMMRKFERNISLLSSDLHGEYLLSKGANLEMSLIDSSFGSPLRGKSTVAPEQMANPLVQTTGAKRYTSPDTTKIESLNKPVGIPIITRTIVNHPPHPITSTNDPKVGPNRPRPPIFQNWKNNSIFRSPKWIGQNKRINRNTYGCSPPKFPRRSGPDFHQQ